MPDFKLILKPGREKSVLQRHPWIFSGAIARLDGTPSPGETVAVISHSGEVLGWAAYSPTSQIRARMWSWGVEEEVNEDFLRRRLADAIARRGWIQETNALRLVHAESDGLPGLIVDRYADVLVVQFLSAGPERWRDVIPRLLSDLIGLEQVYERSDVEVRYLEGLEPRTGVLMGSEPPEWLDIFENGLHFGVDVRFGHKTGFYIDQRPNRALSMNFTSGKDVLNCFAYTGAFAIYALLGGATSVLSIDTSFEALEAGEKHVGLNGFSTSRAEWLQADVFQALRHLRDQARSFDVIILDPPKFAPTAAQADRAARGYKDINRLAFKLLRPGGFLFTFSCSGGVSADLFQKIVAYAALDAGVFVQITHTMTQGPDHPIALPFPEGSYLKGLVCTV